MSLLVFLIPAAILLGLLGLSAFIWSLQSGQYDDLDGAAHRILFEDDEEDAHPAKSSPPAQPGARKAGIGKSEG